MSRVIRVVGVGMGPQHLTPEAVGALRSSAYVVAADKGGDDPLLAARRELCAAHDLEVVAVPDPERDRSDPADYGAAVRLWHSARADAWAAEMEDRPGDPALLVWGDPSVYDSTVRVAWAVADRLDAEVEVVPGISAPQLLAARHRIVLHPVGRPVHLTTERRLREDIEAGQRNLVVMLTSGVHLDGLESWSIWWGANLGTLSEQLVAGRVGDVAGEIEAAREKARSEAGWVMDLFLLRSRA
jgi:precorrin-6A synthase